MKLKVLAAVAALFLPGVSAAATFTVTNTNDAGAGSLRQALIDANAAAGADEIRFNIPGSGVQRILINSTFPNVTGPILLDGRSQPGFSGVPLIELRDNGFLDDCLKITGGSSTVRGLIFNGCDDRSAISLDTGGGNVIVGNYIGTDGSGTAALPNFSALLIENGSSNNVIGGADPLTFGEGCAGDCNLISGNTGVISVGAGLLACSDNEIRNNVVGLAVDGSTPLGNGGIGLFLGPNAQDTIVTGNVFAHNAQGGIRILNGSAGNTIFSNSLFSNGILGIDLLPDTTTTGVTPNDAGDADAGGNGLQNFPVLTAAVSSDAPRVSGTLNGAAGTAFTLEFFSNASCDPSGQGQGRTPLGQATATTDASGDAAFTAVLTTGFAAGEAVTATATDPSGNTSEFSACITATAPGGFAFSEGAVSVGEGDGTASLTIVRSGGAQGAVSVRAATGAVPSGASAVEGGDYEAVSQTVAFADGETSQTVAIPLIDDADPESDEAFTVSLSDPTGGAGVGSPAQLVVTVTDDDGGSGTAGSGGASGPGGGNGGGCALVP